MWTPTTRRQHGREGSRYETDLTDREWSILEPHLPPPSRCGRQRSRSLRAMVNAIFYVLRGPIDLPPWRAMYRWFSAWRDGGVLERIDHAPVMADRERVGREASPSTAILDSQSVKTTEAGGPRNYDAGKKFNGRKRHVLVDSDGQRFFAGIIRNRRLATDFEATIASAGAFLSAASAMLLVRRPARSV